jgi:hypothetical protein
VRNRALRFLERCERGLAQAYRALPPDVLASHEAARHAAQHDKHAALLAACLRRSGGKPAATPYDFWISGLSLEAMRSAEQKSFTTYRDQLTTFEPTTAHMIQTRIMPEHYRALEWLAEAVASRGAAWPSQVHRP